VIKRGIGAGDGKKKKQKQSKGVTRCEPRVRGWATLQFEGGTVSAITQWDRGRLEKGLGVGVDGKGIFGKSGLASRA